MGGDDDDVAKKWYLAWWAMAIKTTTNLILIDLHRWGLPALLATGEGADRESGRGPKER
jgi:hypothetical protein